jgi:hypothetical protein
MGLIRFKYGNGFFYRKIGGINLLLLISPINTDEARESIEGGADIVDVKNPSKDPLELTFHGLSETLET